MEEEVRRWVKLGPNDENRRVIYDRLLRATCYRLPLDIKVKNEEESHLILRRVKSEWSDSEIKWRRLFQEQEEQTRCRATRGILGCISYIDINTGETITCDDYEIRYMTFVQTIKKKKLNGNFESEFKLPPLQKPSIMTLLLSNSNIGWYPHEVIQPDEVNNISGIEEMNSIDVDIPNITYVVDENTEDQNIQNVCGKDEFESPISVVPLKRLKTNV